MTLKSVPSHPRDREASLAGLLQQLDAGESALLLSAAADIALVINADGTLGERVFAGADLPAELFATWPGKAWTDVSTIESRPKIEQMLQEASMGLPPRWRQINHQQPDGADIPVRYCVLKAGSGGQFVAIGPRPAPGLPPCSRSCSPPNSRSSRNMPGSATPRRATAC